MNVLTGQEPKNVVKGFKGYWNRGSLDNVPVDHLSLATNCKYPGQDLVSIREGTSLLDTCPIITGSEYVISYFPYSVVQTGVNVTDFIYLTSSGRLIDGHTSTVLGTFTGGANPPDDIAGLNLFGRAFISLKAVGQAWENSNAEQSSIHYWDGTIFTPIAGAAPTSAPTLSTTTTGGTSAGTYLGAYSYLYKYGYISPPGPTASITVAGNTDILFSGLPSSYPTGVIAVVLLLSTANGSDLFFVPGAGQVTATSYDWTGFDTDLIDDAEYLYDVLPIVPNGAALKFYHGRMVVLGGHGVENIVLFSEQLDPETFNDVTDIITTPIDFVANSVSSGTIINDSFYIHKPNGSFVTQDNGGDPATWPLTATDAGLGGFDVGISNFGGQSVDILDNVLVCTPRGLMLFTGAFQDIPLSFKIDALWRSINPKALYLFQIAHDIWNKRVYISVPLSGSGANSTVILMMDYQEGGLNPTSVKWSVWFFNTSQYIFKILQGVYLISGSGNSNISQQLLIAFGNDANLYTISASNLCDYGSNAIQQEIRTAGLMLDKPGMINMFLMIRLCIQFNDSLILQGFNGDQSLNYSFVGFTNAPAINFTDLAIGSTTNLVTSAGHPFSSINIGNILNITSGTGFIPGQYVIDNVSGVVAEISAPIGSLGDTGGHGNIPLYYSGQELERWINITTEKLILKFANDTAQLDSWFQLNRIDLYGQAMWNMRPALSQSS
jgi:hypothetical protein